MDPAAYWWLTETSQGRRVLDRMIPASALPMTTRRQMCAEQGHVPLGDGSCQRCGDRNINNKRNKTRRNHG